MSIIDTLVTDRTLADYQLWKTLKALGWQQMTAEQRAQWSPGMKGAYKASDMNRVTEAVAYLVGVFEGLGYPVPGYTDPGIVWAIGDIPQDEQLALYLSNVRALMDVLEEAKYTADLPASMALLTYAGANHIEEILVEINAYLESMQAVFLRASMPWAYAGEGYYLPDLWLYLYTSDGLLVVTEDDMAVQVR